MIYIYLTNAAVLPFQHSVSNNNTEMSNLKYLNKKIYYVF